MKLQMKKTVYPSKKTVNLVYHEKTINSPSRALPAFALFLVLLGIFVKFGVVDQMARAGAAEAASSRAQAQLKELQDYNADFDAVTEEYNKYSNNYLTADEKLLTNRSELLDRLEEDVMSRAPVTSFNVSGQTCQLVVTSVKLDMVAQIVAALEQSPIVAYIAVSTAGTNQNNSADQIQAAGDNQLVTANLTITLAGGEIQ